MAAAKKGGNWIAAATPPSSKGALHRNLGVPQGQKIPKAKIKKAAAGNGKVAKEARLAETLEGLRGKK